jgi:hypothetical protein
MNYHEQRFYNAYIKKGIGKEEALQLALKSEQYRKQKVRESRVNMTKGDLLLTSQKGASKRKRQKRSEESKQKMREAYQKFRLENPEKFKERYKTRIKTISTRTVEEKDILKQKRSNSIKLAWADPQNKETYLKRNKKISESISGYTRTEKSKQKQAFTNTGKKQSIETKTKRALTRERKMANGEYLGLRCKVYNIQGLNCQGGSEKAYIELLIRENKPLPTNATHQPTPLGIYHPDFEYNNKFIEVKSEYTYKIFNGDLANINEKISLNQKEKATWVSRNLKPVEVIVINNKGIVVKTEIL